jgi:uncharacterized YccA/Bax inhibitor family protein
MALFKSGNPALSEKRFKDTILEEVVTHDNAMTVKGTLNKFGILFLLTLATSYYSWKETVGNGSSFKLVCIGAFGGLIIAIFYAFKKEWGQYLAPAYALLEGLFLGAISAYYEYSAATTVDGFYAGYPGIVMQAIGLTFCVVGAMYLLYKFNIIRATEKFKTIIIVATTGLALFYLVTWILNLAFNIAPPGFLFQNSALGIGFSVFVVALAALNLILDFDMIERGSEMGAPKYMEWYGAFGLLVTIVWLYLEILRLLSKLKK